VNLQKSYAPSSAVPASGTLYLVATPIGNLEDMTFRAIRTLKEVQLIAAEDTRQTRKLLTHFEVATRLVSYHEHNKQASGPELVRLLLEGQSIALVSDAGLPAISDPGFDLVRMAVEQSVPVVPIPGANAALSALIASGLPTDRFTFVGFLPREKKDLTKELERLAHLPETLIFYESPHRVVKTLERMAEVWGAERRICLARELTKKFEEFARGTIEECLAHLAQHAPLGEYCLIAEGGQAAGSPANGAWWEALTLAEHVERYVQQGQDKKEATKQAAADRGVPKREVYNALLEKE
jgi:16S rRNA (cytidine1402-2'-O)-methyltransferase